MGKASFYFFYFLLRVKRLTFDQKFRTMKKLLFLIVFVFPVFVFAQVSVDAGCFRHVDSSTGLSAVYVIGNENTVTMHYTSSSTDEIYWYRFGAEGLSSRVEMMGTQSGNVSVLVSSYKDCGYMVKQNSDSLCFWISSYRSVGSCEAGEEQENIREKDLLSLIIRRKVKGSICPGGFLMRLRNGTMLPGRFSIMFLSCLRQKFCPIPKWRFRLHTGRHNLRLSILYLCLGAVPYRGRLPEIMFRLLF